MDNQEQRYSEEEANSIIEFALRAQSKIKKEDLASIMNEFDVEETIQEQAFNRKTKKSLIKNLSFNKKDILFLPLDIMAGANVGAVVAASYGWIYSLATGYSYLSIIKSGAKYGALLGVTSFLFNEGIKLFSNQQTSPINLENKD
jgi:hypothetical protein